MAYMKLVAELTPEHLQGIFEHLPEPSYAWLELCGFDYSSIKEQASRLFPRVQLGDVNRRQTVSMEHPTKERILEVHASSYGTEDLGHPDFTKPRIKLDKVYWDLKPDAEIDLFPVDSLKSWNVEIRCWGEEPQYLSGLRAELLRSGIRFQVKANSH